MHTQPSEISVCACVLWHVLCAHRVPCVYRVPCVHRRVPCVHRVGNVAPHSEGASRRAQRDTCAFALAHTHTHTHGVRADGRIPARTACRCKHKCTQFRYARNAAQRTPTQRAAHAEHHAEATPSMRRAPPPPPSTPPLCQCCLSLHTYRANR